MTKKTPSAERLKELVKVLEGKQNVVAQRIGVKQPHLSDMVNGKKNLSGEFLKKLTRGYPEVNINWLVSGEGDMFISNNEYTRVLNEDPTEYVPLSQPHFSDAFASADKALEELYLRSNHQDDEMVRLVRVMETLQDRVLVLEVQLELLRVKLLEMEGKE